MNGFKLLPVAVLALVVAAPAVAQRDHDQNNGGQYGNGDNSHSGQQGGYDPRNGQPYNNGPYNNGQQNRQSYDQNDDANFHAEEHYRQGRNYRERTLSQNDRVYHGQDNRYYCRRSDGTTGLIVGGIGGGVLGNLIAPGGSKTLGTLLGGGLGAVAGNTVGRNRVRCR